MLLVILKTLVNRRYYREQKNILIFSKWEFLTLVCTAELAGWFTNPEADIELKLLP
jgi:hypothetical protein